MPVELNPGDDGRTDGREIAEKIERAIAEFDRGGGIPESRVRACLEELKATQLPTVSEGA